MPTKQAIIAAIDAADHQLRAVADRLRARPTTPIPDGDWTVQELLGHVAATADYRELFRRIETYAGAFPTLKQMEDQNERQRQALAGYGVDALLAEAEQGFAQARAAVGQLTDPQLADAAPMSDGSAMTVGEVVMVAIEHAQGHITQLEQASGAAD